LIPLGWIQGEVPIWALERRPIFFRILRTWFATVCSEIESSDSGLH
jgi:hypothetical protein